MIAGWMGERRGMGLWLCFIARTGGVSEVDDPSLFLHHHHRHHHHAQVYFFEAEELADLARGAGLEVVTCDYDRRLIVNRKKKLKVRKHTFERLPGIAKRVVRTQFLVLLLHG